MEAQAHAEGLEHVAGAALASPPGLLPHLSGLLALVSALASLVACGI